MLLAKPRRPARSPLARRIGALAGAGAVVLASCRDATAVRVHVYTDVAWVTGRRVVITAATDAVPSTSEPLAEIAEPWRSPDLGDFVLLPSASKNGPVRLAVVMGITKDPRACSVEAPDGCIFARRKLGFLEYRTLTVPVTVYSACIGIPCSPDTTCNALGQCVPAEVDPDDCASPDGCFLPGEQPPASLRPPTADAGADADARADAGAEAGGDAGADAGPDAGPDGGAATGWAVTAGTMFTCARFPDGRLKCWGYNASGELGLGDTANRGDAPGEMGDALPSVSLGAGRSARALGVAMSHTCTLLDNDQVKCWGLNSSGRLGLGDTAQRGDGPAEMGDALPVVGLGAGRSARAVAPGGFHSCALLDNDQVKCWGDNAYGQLGLGDIAARGNEPAEMGDALPFISLGAGRSARAVAPGGFHSCALLDNDQVKCWGNNAHGQLGLGDVANRGDGPAEMGDALPFVDLGAGRSARAVQTASFHTCALLDNDQVKCWGDNVYGQLGLGDTADRGAAPGQMGDALPFVSLGAGRSARALGVTVSHTCALLDNGQIKCWGNNSSGQLGLGDTTQRGDDPTEMGDALPFVSLGAGRSARAIAAGSSHTCAVLDNDRVKCWGGNGYGQLGLGDTESRGDGPGEMGDALPLVDLGP